MLIYVLFSHTMYDILGPGQSFPSSSTGAGLDGEDRILFQALTAEVTRIRTQLNNMIAVPPCSSSSSSHSTNSSSSSSSSRSSSSSIRITLVIKHLNAIVTQKIQQQVILPS